MKKTKSLYHGHRLPAVVISCPVRWYFRFSLSLRDIEELLLERGVTYETIRCWCDKFGAGFAQCAKATRRKAGGTWHRDEMFVTLRGEPYLLWRAVDEHGTELGASPDRYRPAAQLCGGEGRYSRTGEHGARVCQSGCTSEQPRREQPPANPQARTPDVRISRSSR